MAVLVLILASGIPGLETSCVLVKVRYRDSVQKQNQPPGIVNTLPGACPASVPSLFPQRGPLATHHCHPETLEMPPPLESGFFGLVSPLNDSGGWEVPGHHGDA